ncbi:KdsC family phosphatase [Facilibium subflavum]|uniref:KdsC family phosphatase n=1 Tax=Facilibium subflavum TaxID=2219058 RepID=UPI000E65C743|nr:HAD-IIIA family hydrolase [Facilibium subflavum]
MIRAKISHIEKLKQISLFIVDVDGVLTDGKIIVTNQGDESKHFDVKDGLGIVLLQKAGVKVAVITGKVSKIVENRLSALGVRDIFQNQKNKQKAFAELKSKYQLQDSQIAYMGDDLPDLTLLARVGFSAAPQDAHKVVTDKVDYVSAFNGGCGAVREIADLILQEKGLWDKMIADYIAHGEAIF